MSGALSLQRADPLGALAGRRLTSSAAAAVVVFAVVLTVVAHGEVGNWFAAAAGVALTVVAATILITRTGVNRAPFTRGWAVAVMVFGLAAHVASVIAQWPSGPHIDDWGPYVIALLLLALVPYRPVPETIVMTVVSAAWVVAVTALQESVAGSAVVGLAAVVAVTPVLALPLAGAAFATDILDFVGRWRVHAIDAAEEEARRKEVEITRAVQETRASILDRDVSPFYSELLERGALVDSDADRAAQLASSIRAVMLADTERSWLDELIEPPVRVDGAVRIANGVRDVKGLSRLMDLDQRTALRALIGAVGRLPGSAGTIAVTIQPIDEGCEAVLTATIESSRHRTARALRPYLAVLSSVFSDYYYEIRADRLTVRFCYARP